MRAKFSQAGSNERFEYGDVWQRGKTAGPERLIIGPSGRHVELLLRLSLLLAEPIGVLYVLVVSRRNERPVGRYQCAELKQHAQVEQLLQTFADYFEGDGRHHIWVQSVDTDDLLIYDRHDILYAYGRLDVFEQELRTAGFREGSVDVPVPHLHRYEAQFDEAEQRLMDHWEWLHFPLEPPDKA